MSAHPGQFEGRVVSVAEAAADVRVLLVEIAGGLPLAFEAGQYVFLEAEGSAPRAFSIASAPGNPLLEFHVRDSGRGFSALAVHGLKPGSPLTLKGPFGANVWHKGAGPLLALAGGVGIAPLKSIAERHLAAGGGAPLHLYWGARDRAALYLHAHFTSLAEKHPSFRYVPVVADAAGAENFRTGFAPQAADADFADLRAFTVYMAGPKNMIDAALPLLLHKNAARERIFSDAFYA